MKITLAYPAQYGYYGSVMKMATITQTKNNLSALIHEAQRGETIIVLDRKKPVARIESIAPANDEEDAARLDRLQREGILLKPRDTSLDGILNSRPRRIGKGAGAVHALCKEREEGR